MDYKRYYAEYLQNGCLKIENFFTAAEVEEMKVGLSQVVDNIPDEELHVFQTYNLGKTKDDDEYYINSGDKIRYFFETEAFDDKGNLLVDRKEALCKIGYATHWWNPVFRKYTFHKKVKDLLRSFEYKDPVVVQSMIIFKKPKIGEIVKPHQDSTFLYTEPLSCIGLWFPLEDATIENGCLWYVPGSHKGAIHQRFKRNPKKNPMFIVEGKPHIYKDEDYVAAPAKIGDCVVIHGSVMHKSGKNTTDRARTIYTYHAVEKDAAWSPDNWLQPTKTLPFPSVYDN